VVVLRELEDRNDIVARLAGIFEDHRDPDYVEHNLEELLYRNYSLEPAMTPSSKMELLLRAPGSSCLSRRRSDRSTGSRRRRSCPLVVVAGDGRTVSEADGVYDFVRRRSIAHQIPHTEEEVGAVDFWDGWG
jgi:hypothetical protein